MVTSFRLGAAVHGLRIGPKQLAHDSIFWWLAVAVRLSDVIQRNVITGEQSTVHNL